MPRSEPASGTVGLRALAHPLRLRLLSLLTAHAMSAAEAARELGESQANVSYHLRRLHAAGLLEVAEEVAVRGGRAKRFRHDPASGERLSGNSRDEHRLLAEALGQELIRRTAERRLGAPGVLTDAEMWVDPEQWQQLRDGTLQLSGALHAAARPPHTRGTVRVSATIALFEMEGGGTGHTAAGGAHVAGDS